MRRSYSRFIGIDLGGARGKTTAIARLSAVTAAGQEAPVMVEVEDVSTRCAGAEPWHDEALFEYLGSLGRDTVIAINAPLTVPACVRCREPVCPGKEACVDPAVEWLRSAGAELVSEAHESDLDRIAVIPAGRSLRSGHNVLPMLRSRPRIEPYMHRATELYLHFERGLLPRDCLGQSTGPIAARAAHLVRMLAGMGFELHRNLLEVSPRATVHALFGAGKARGYKRDADPWETRVAIVEAIDDLRFGPRSRLSREEVLRNDHCFDALLSSYTAYLWARDGWSLPEGIFARDGWIWAPPE